MENFAELARCRQSVRRYTDRPVEREKLEQCLETTRLSPSANNAQPWRFVVVDRPELRAEVARCAMLGGMNRWASEAPVFVVVVLERPNLLAAVGSVLQNKEYRLLDVGMAANQFCLQAADLGLGTCMVGWFDEKRVRRLLGVPRGKRIPLLIAVGYGEEPLRAKIRKTTDAMASWNRY